MLRSWRSLAIAAVLGAACGGGSTSPVVTVIGTHGLVGVNTSPLPAEGVFNASTHLVTSGSLLVNDSTYAFVICANTTGTTTATPPCGAGQLALTGGGRVLSTDFGVSFVNPITFSSRGLVVTDKTLTFRYGDADTTKLVFTR